MILDMGDSCVYKIECIDEICQDRFRVEVSRSWSTGFLWWKKHHVEFMKFVGKSTIWRNEETGHSAGLNLTELIMAAVWKHEYKT